MTEKKLQEALILKDDITRTAKSVETIEHLFEEWNKLHQKSECDALFKYVDRKKEWEIISTMAQEFDVVRETIINSTLHQLRIRQRELREELTRYERKLAKL